MLFRLILIILFCLFPIHIFAEPFGLRQTDKTIQFNGSAELNYTIINTEPYIQFLAVPELTFGKINLGFGFYLPLETSQDYYIRKIEYKSSQSIFSKLHYIQYGLPWQHPISIKISRIDEFTLGHGLIVNRYSNDITFPEIRRQGVQIAIKSKGIYFQGIIGDIITQSTMGGRLSTRLGELFKIKNDILGSIEIGFSFMSDLNPKKRDAVLVNSNTDHQIVRRNDQGYLLYVLGGDLSITLLKTSIINLGIYSELANINQAGTGIGYGIYGSFFPKSLNIEYKFQFRHLFNSFTPGYFDSFYEAYRSTKIDTISNNNAKYGWYIELSRFFYEKKIGMTISYEETFNGTYNPHIFLKFYTNNLPNRFYFTIRFDQYNSINFKINNTQSLFLFEILYGFTENLKLGVTYLKGLTREENPSEALQNLTYLGLYTKIVF